MEKEKVITALENLPNKFRTKELSDKIIFMDKVEKGLADAREGRVISFDETRKRITK